MSTIYSWANLCILALFLLVNDSISQVNHQIKFKRMAKCPTENAKLHQEKLSSKAECAIVCAGESCNRFYFDPVTKSCYLGEACSDLSQWADGDCESFQYTEQQSETVKTGIPNPLFEQLQMKLFYKFKSSGLWNEANPGQFCLAANNVIVDNNGAHFRGNNGSYLSTKTPGFEQFLDYGNVFSFYVRVRHVMNAGYTVYHRVLQCNAPLEYGNTFAKASSFVFSFVHWTNGGLNKVSSRSQNFLPTNGQSDVQSVGYTYNRTAIQHFYSSLHPTLLVAFPDSSQSVPGSTSASNFQCLRLGYSPVNELNLNGTMYCYGMSTKILSFDDYKLLDAYCNA